MELNFDPDRIKKILDNMENSQLKQLEEGLAMPSPVKKPLPISTVSFDRDEAHGDALAAAMADFKKDNMQDLTAGDSLYSDDAMEFDDVAFRSNFQKDPKYKKELEKNAEYIDKRYRAGSVNEEGENLNLPKEKPQLTKHNRELNANYYENQPKSMKEWSAEDEGPQPGDSEYHYPGPNKKQHGLSKFNDIDWQVLHETIVANTEFQNTGKVEGNPRFYEIHASDLTDSGEGMMTPEDLNLLKEHGVLDVTSNRVTFGDNKYLNFDDFYQAVQDAWSRGFPPSHNDNSSEIPYLRGREIDEEVNKEYEDEKEFYFDTKSLYHFLQDAFDQLSIYNEAEAAQILEKELLKYYDVTPKKLEEASGILRPKDANGVDITNKSRVVHVETGYIGHVLRPGVNDKSEQIIQVDWMKDPSTTDGPGRDVYPTEIVVDDDTRIVREATSHSIPNGRSANGRPETFPGYFERDIANKNLANNGTPEIFSANRITNTEFDIMANARAMNAQKEDPLMNIVPKPAVETIKYTMYEKEKLEEGYDFAAAERDFHNQANLEDLAQYTQKAIEISNPNAIVMLANNSERRLNSIMDSLKEELEAMRVNNNTVIATDYLDTNWVFNIDKVDDSTVYVTFKKQQ